MSDAASDLFWDAFMTGGAKSITCQCGREHFTTQAAEWEDGEDDADFLELQELSRNAPGRVIGTSDDSVAWCNVNGIVFCYGCPCKSIARFQSFLDNCQDEVLAYYSAKLKAKSAETDRLSESMLALRQAREIGD